jgi:hypothetical protein
MAAPSPKPGSDLGRPAIDWEQAFAHYAALPPERRCYQAVADQFGVSVRTVQTHGRLAKWAERLHLINAEVAAEANIALGHARAEQITKLMKLIDASLIGYAEPPRRGEMRMTAVDLCLLGLDLDPCEQLGRRCFAVELDRGYCDVVRQRYEGYKRGG